MSEFQPSGEDEPKIFIGINPETGELAEYILGKPCAEIDEGDFIDARTDPKVHRLIGEAHEIGRLL